MRVAAGLQSLNGQRIAHGALVPAGAIRAAAPPEAMVLMRQRRFIAGLAAGRSRLRAVAGGGRRALRDVRGPEAPPLAGLDPAARYRVSLHAPVALSAAALTGGALMPPAVYPETMLVLEGARL